MVADVAIPLEQVRVVPVAAGGDGPTVAAIQQALARPDTRVSRWSTPPAGSSATCTSRMCCLPSTIREAVVDHSTIRPLPEVPEALPLPDALTRLRRNNISPGAGDGPDGAVVAIVALEDLVEDLVGTVRDGTHRV